MVIKKDTPIWQPLEMLPLIKGMIEEYADDSVKLLTDLRHFESSLGGLDDATLDQTVRCYTEQKEQISLYSEQLKRWETDPNIIEKQRKEIVRLGKRLEKHRKTVDSILSLAEKLRGATIENLLGKSDIETAIDFLLGKTGFGGTDQKKKGPSKGPSMPFPTQSKPSPMVLNQHFLKQFIKEEPPCFALGMLENESTIKGFIAMNPGEAIPRAVTARGFNLGQQILSYRGNEIIHLIMRFYDYQDYHMLLNPNHNLVRTVLGRMVEIEEYFFLVYDTGYGLTAFHQTLSLGGLEMKNIVKMARKSKTKESVYDEAVESLYAGFHEEDEFLDWVCRDNMEFLDLSKNRFEIAPV